MVVKLKKDSSCPLPASFDLAPANSRDGLSRRTDGECSEPLDVGTGTSDVADATRQEAERERPHRTRLCPWRDERDEVDVRGDGWNDSGHRSF